MHAPKILAAATEIYKKRVNSQGSQAARAANWEAEGEDRELHLSIKQLEDNQIQQAALLRDIATQIEALSKAVQVLRSRVAIALGAAALALLIALSSLLIILL
jgi:hypothetical protein